MFADYLYLGIWNLNVLPWNECRREAAGDGTNQKDSKEIMKWKEKESIGKYQRHLSLCPGTSCL